MVKKLVFVFLLACFALSMNVSANDNEGDFFVVTATSGLRLRSGPSTSHSAISLIPHGTMIQVTEYNPEGFSVVTFGYLEGYVSSEWIQRAAQIATTAGLHFRSGPSTSHTSMGVLPNGTVLSVIEYNPDGFSLVVHNNQTGYVFTQYTRRLDNNPLPVVNTRTNMPAPAAITSMTRESSMNSRVELLHWNDIRRILTSGTFIEIYDVRTGLVYTIRAFSVGGHADVEPISQFDTDVVWTAAGGRWSWDARPVIATINGRSFAAAIHSMPHANSTILDNGMDGHLCLHFLGVVTSNLQWTASMQEAVHEAYRWANSR